MKSVCIKQSIWLAVHIERAHICAINRIQCNCGPVYEVVDPKDRARDLNLFKCLVCGKEIISAKAYKVGDLRLIVRPKPDRDTTLRAFARRWRNLAQHHLTKIRRSICLLPHGGRMHWRGTNIW